MKRKNNGILFSVWVLLLVLLAGCTTPRPKTPEELNGPYQGYVYYSALQGNEGFQQENIPAWLAESMKQIASEEFQQRYKAQMSKEKSLEKQAEYIALLKQPITIGEDQWKEAIDDGWKKKEKEVSEAFWNANESLSFDGGQIYPEWGNELSSAELHLKTDTSRAEGFKSDIDRLRGGYRFRDALVVADVELRPYMPERAGELVEDLKSDATDYWVKKHLLEIDGLRKTEKYDGAHELQVRGLFDTINDDVAVFGHHEDFNRVYRAWMDLLGENWSTRIIAMGTAKQYWDAYEFAAEKYEYSKFAEAYREGLRLSIGRGYLEILDNAIRYYNDLASTAHTKSLDGKAYVYCCMAKEMYDFVPVCGMFYAGDEAKKWYGRITDLEENDIAPTLSARVARRVVIEDFDLDTEGLSKRFRESCLEKYSLGNDHAWALEVVVDKVALAQLEAGSLPVEPDDYVIKWSNVEVDVKVMQDPPSQRTAFVKTDDINLVDNPFRKNKSSEFYKLKQVQAQKVALYSLIDTKLGLNLSCDMKVSCQHRGNEGPLKLPVTEDKVEEYNEAYGSGINTTSLLLLSNVSEEMKYYSPDVSKKDIPRDDIPKNRKFVLPEEELIRAGLVQTVITDLFNELEKLVDMYPVELLADVDRDDPSQYLDSLGTILFYVVNLSVRDAEKLESAGMGYQWLHMRDQINENMKEWCGSGERWGAVGVDESRIMSSLWEECIQVSNEQDER